MDREATVQFFQMLAELTDAMMPLMASMAAVALGIALATLGAGWLLRHAENAITGLALRLEDGRKKKRDEYDAYYDQLIADRLSDPEPEPNIAYYEDDHTYLTK